MIKQGPYSIGSASWPGISKLIEEAGEVCQVAGKIMGTGGAVNHWDGTDLKVRLEDEIADLMAACKFVIHACGLDSARIGERMSNKRTLFERWHRDPIATPTDVEPKVQP